MALERVHHQGSECALLVGAGPEQRHLGAGLTHRHRQRPAVGVDDLAGAGLSPHLDQLVSGREDRHPRAPHDVELGVTEGGRDPDLGPTQRGAGGDRQDLAGARVGSRCVEGAPAASRSGTSTQSGPWTVSSTITTLSAPAGRTAPVRIRHASRVRSHPRKDGPPPTRRPPGGGRRRAQPRTA